MARIDALLEPLGHALADRGRRALAGDARFGEVLPDVAKAALDRVHRDFPDHDPRAALAAVAAAGPDVYADHLARLVGVLAQSHHLKHKDALVDYLALWPATVRQVLRRPSDPTGRTVPDRLQVLKPDDLLMFLPPRRPRFHPGPGPAGLDDWELAEFQGMGESTEVWVGTSQSQPTHSPAALKFATDPGTVDAVAAHAGLFQKVFELNGIPGIAPLRSVYPAADPPCLEVGYVHGYDLTGLIHEWKWRFDAAKPEAALKVVKRLAEVVGQAHKRGLVHRDLKPSNVLLHPTEGGKFTLWVTDWGWGQIAAARSAELGRGGTPWGEQHRLELRGAHSTLYAAPQVSKKDPPDPRDDVHALGAIWYQLLKRDPMAPPPVGADWAEEFYPAGFTESQARLLLSCLATRPDRRPADANAFLDHLAGVAVAVASPQDGSRLIPLRGPGSSTNLLAAPPALTGVGTVKMGKSLGGPAAVKARAADPDELPPRVANSVGMLFALIPAGKFLMGAPDAEPGRRDHDGPQHEVTITKPFYLAVCPVTQGQYEQVMKKNPAHFDKKHGGGPDHPVETVGWADAEKFCHKLGHLPDEEGHGRSYRLPTEAEWEYACRAGTATAYWCGPKLTPTDAQFSPAGVTGKPAGAGKTTAVGQTSPNAWGLHDMHGNVAEWVGDWFDEYYYLDAPKADPPGPAHGMLKGARGGCWVSAAADCRSAARRGHPPDRPSNAIGFRVVLEVGG